VAILKPTDRMVSPEQVAVFDRRAFPERFCNFDRLLKMMATRELDGVVSSYTPNVFYLTGFTGTMPMFEADSLGVVIVPREHPEQSVLIVHDPSINFFRYQPTWVKDVRAYSVVGDLGHRIEAAGMAQFIPAPLEGTPIGLGLPGKYYETQASAIVQALKDVGLDGEDCRLGFDNLLTANNLVKAGEFPGTVVEVYGAFKYVRQVKTKAEMDLLRLSTKLNQTAITETVASWTPGMTWRELNHVYGRIVYDLGGWAEPVPNIQMNYDVGDPMAAKPLPLPLTIGLEPDYVIRAGANMMFDCHGWLNRYCWDGGKTWFVQDEPSGDGRRISTACGHAIEEIVAAMRPGKRVSELQALGRAVFRREGLPSDAPLVYFHGLGLEHSDLEIPTGSERAIQHRLDWPLEAGMVVAIHLAYPGELRERYYIEEVAIVTEDGAGSPLFDWGVEPLLNH
jgi:Xaa-Pro dipeptidase